MTDTMAGSGIMGAPIPTTVAPITTDRIITPIDPITMDIGPITGDTGGIMAGIAAGMGITDIVGATVITTSNKKVARASSPWSIN